VAGFCEHSNEPSGSIAKAGYFCTMEYCIIIGIIIIVITRMHCMYLVFLWCVVGISLNNDLIKLVKMIRVYNH
jgi:hypothetical protein